MTSLNTAAPGPIPTDPTAGPHVVLDGDMPSCSECDSTRLVAVAHVERRFAVAGRATLRSAANSQPILWLVQSPSPAAAPRIACEECGNTLRTDGLLDVRESV